MAVLAVELDIGPAFAHVIGHRLFQIQDLPELVEVADLDAGAELDGPGLRFEFAQQQPQQRGFADPVIADQADAVAAHDLDREIPDDLLVAIAVADVPGAYDLAARLLGLLDVNARRVFACDALFTFLAHALQRPDTPLVARASRLDALAYPGFFLFQALVETLLSGDLVLQCLFLAPQVVLVIAGPAGEPAPVDLDDAGREPLQERAVVRNEHHGARVTVDLVFEPSDGRDIEMIGRFVEQQQVWLLHERPGQRNAPTPAARQLVHLLVGGQAQLGDGRFDALVEVPAFVGVDFCMQRLELPEPVPVERELRHLGVGLEQAFDLRQAGADDLGDRQVHGRGEILFQLADDQVGFRDDLTAVGFQRAHDQLQCRRLARAVTADEADPFAGFDRKLGISQNHLLAEFQTDAVESQQRHERSRGVEACILTGITFT